MGQTVVLVLPESATLERLMEAFRGDTGWRYFDDDAHPELQLSSDQGSVRIWEIADRVGMIEDYKEDESARELLKAVVHNSRFFHVKFEDLPMLKVVLSKILAVFKDAFVDDDYGTVHAGELFRARLVSDLDWDWRL